MRNFQIPVPPSSTNKSIRFPDHLISRVEQTIRGTDCTFSAFVVAAVRSALTSTGKLILQDHLEHCIVDAIEQGDREPVDQLMKAIEQFVK